MKETILERKQDNGEKLKDRLDQTVGSHCEGSYMPMPMPM